MCFLVSGGAFSAAAATSTLSSRCPYFILFVYLLAIKIGCKAFASE